MAQCCRHFFYVLFGDYKYNVYFCSMKKEIGKWFMDVAKYIATAVLLTQIFGGMADSVYIIIYALISVVFIFALGVSIIHSDDEDKKRKERNQNKRKDKK